MACYDVYDSIAPKWHRAPSPIPLHEFLDLVASDGAAKSALLGVVDISKATQPQEPVHRRLKREAENGWYKGEEKLPSRARPRASQVIGAAAAELGATAAAQESGGSNAMESEETRRRLAEQPPVSAGAGLDAAAVEALVKRAIAEEVGSLRARVGELEEEVLALRKKLASAP
jgi:hypothetical protein